ncbi:MAG: polymer-forming cytoskeletal protein, partial [Syntrophales bacterium]|nr:polymer-forming cytoskeletal protein [Syntrophales bacterium]
CPATILFVLLCCFLLFPAPVSAVNIFKIGDVTVEEEGTKVNNVVSVRGQITVAGHVDGNVVALGGSVVLTKRAFVGGNVISVGGIIVMGRGAEVHGRLAEINAANISDYLTEVLSEEWEGWSWVWAVFSLAIFTGILIIALLIVVLIPKPLRIVARAIKEETLRITLWGLLGLVLVVPLAVLLTISVIGIVLIPLEMILVVSASLMGFIAFAQVIGERLYALFKKKNQPMIKETFWGLVVLWLVGWLPYIGWMLKVIVVMMGLGAVIFTRFGTYVSRRMENLARRSLSV